MPDRRHGREAAAPALSQLKREKNEAKKKGSCPMRETRMGQLPRTRYGAFSDPLKAHVSAAKQKRTVLPEDAAGNAVAVALAKLNQTVRSLFCLVHTLDRRSCRGTGKSSGKFCNLKALKRCAG